MIARRFGERRAGVTAVAVLVMLPVLLLLAGLALYAWLATNAKTESQNGADAAALAAALALATDDRLVEDDLERPAERTVRWLVRSRNAARELGGANFAGGEQLKLDHGDDVVFGRLDHPYAEFATDVSSPGEVNAVCVTVRRGAVRAPLGGKAPDRDVVARATAMLDWRVVGFRAKDDEPLPVVPVAILTDPSGRSGKGWHARHAAARSAREDSAAFDPDARRFAPGPDGIPEITVILGPRHKDDGDEAPGAAFLRLGTASMEFVETVEQIRSGVRCEESDRKSRGELLLGEDNILHIPGSPECPTVGSRGREFTDAAFRALRDSGEPRAWPLFSDASPNGEARVCGWVGARVVSVSAAKGGGIKLVLQPAVVCHPSVVTEKRDNPPAFWGTNRTVCRVRLAG